MRLKLSPLWLGAVAISVTATDIDASTVYGAVSVAVNEQTGQFTLLVDGKEWLASGTIAPLGFGVLSSTPTSGTDNFGTFTAMTLGWGRAGGSVTLETEYRSYSSTDLVVLTQRWPYGFEKPPPAPPSPVPPSPPAKLCAEVHTNSDQAGGKLMRELELPSEEACCMACIQNTSCDAWVVSTDLTPQKCYLIQGHRSTKPSSTRSMGIVRGPGPPADPFIAAFPTFSLTSMVPLGYLSWGGCQVQGPTSGAWNATTDHPSMNGVTSGEPLVLHAYGAKPRAVAIAPATNFFVSGQAIFGGDLQCGIRSTVSVLPKGFSHSTVVVGGTGINGTLVALGDHLLGLGQKARTDPQSDFVLSHLGYWTDNGAYYYHQHTNFSTAEDALKAVKADLGRRDIPVRYFQWDDWWMESEGDQPGILSWQPNPQIFPSGFTDWLGEPLSMYAPMYSKDNVWNTSYTWKLDPAGGRSAIPLDPHFYHDLFTNGTKIGQKMFEQDFMCTYNGDTGLTNSDVSSGMEWVANMDAAAIATNNTLQWCMMNPCHALASTAVKRMTNGRATGDNCRGNPANILSMGPNGMLYYALGFFASRDNVWTTPADVEQPSCNRYCFEPNRHADNAVAFLGGGPYGPSDAVGFTDKAIVMYTCRTDGVLLRPSWPLSVLDLTYSFPPVPPGASADPRDRAHLWAAHDDHGGGAWRWSYLVSLNSPSPLSVTASDLQGAVPGQLAAWVVEVGAAVTAVTRIPAGERYTLGPSPAGEHGPNISHATLAPVLPSGLVVLGETSKWATMSHRRFDQLAVSGSGMTARVRGAPAEVVQVAFAPAGSSAVDAVQCRFPATGCGAADMHGDVDCELKLTCTATSCQCQ